MRLPICAFVSALSLLPLMASTAQAAEPDQKVAPQRLAQAKPEQQPGHDGKEKRRAPDKRRPARRANNPAEKPGRGFHKKPNAAAPAGRPGRKAPDGRKAEPKPSRGTPPNVRRAQPRPAEPSRRTVTPRTPGRTPPGARGRPNQPSPDNKAQAPNRGPAANRGPAPNRAPANASRPNASDPARAATSPATSDKDVRAGRRRGGRPGGRRSERIEQIKAQRKTRTENGGKRQIIQEPGQRTIIRENNRVVIRHNDSNRFERFGKVNQRRRGPNGRREIIVNRPGGVQIITVLDSRGNLISRRRRHRNGRETWLIDNRRFFGKGKKFAIAAGIAAFTVALAAPKIGIARDRYIVGYDRASEEDLYDALYAPPVEALPRAYSLEEIRYSHSLRERMRRIDLDAVTFETGSWDVSPEEGEKLRRLAQVMRRILKRNPDEIFMIEGHTDLVGSDVDNLTLSDRRAESVAVILTEEFGIPPENLVTQGYGEQFPKIDTQGPEVANRRVSVRRITPLLAHRNR